MNKLYRSKTDKKLGGVCGGFAEYLNIDSTIIRVLFILFACFAGSGLLAYLLMYLIMPEEQ